MRILSVARRTDLAHVVRYEHAGAEHVALVRDYFGECTVLGPDLAEVACEAALEIALRMAIAEHHARPLDPHAR